jgi:hypothetical protein
MDVTYNIHSYANWLFVSIAQGILSEKSRVHQCASHMRTISSKSVATPCLWRTPTNMPYPHINPPSPWLSRFTTTAATRSLSLLLSLVSPFALLCPLFTYLSCAQPAPLKQPMAANYASFSRIPSPTVRLQCHHNKGDLPHTTAFLGLNAISPARFLLHVTWKRK